MIIVINGTSSSGKTSLLKAIQNESEDLFLEYGIDKFIFMLPKRYLNTQLWNDVLGRADSAGETGHKLVECMHMSAQKINSSGMNVIVDHVLVEERWRKHLADTLDKKNTYLIKMYCPLEVLEEREKARKDRTLGQARKQYNLVHMNIEYDMEIDSSKMTAEDAAKQILEYMRLNKPKWKIGI